MAADPFHSSEPAPLPVAPPLGCWERGCSAQPEYACAYRDSQGLSCGSRWCPAHVEWVNTDCFCRRHAAPARALAGLGESWASWGKALPPVDDRSLNLLQLTHSQIGERVMAALKQTVSATPRAGIDQDQQAAPVYQDNRFVGWERGWAAFTAEGFLHRVVLRAFYGEPPVVELISDGRQMISAVPDWIAVRATAPEQIEPARVAYKERLCLLVERALGVSAAADQAAVSTTQSLLQVVKVPCRWGGCSNLSGGACQYTDASGLRCASYWCSEHLDQVNNLVVCRRHGRMLTLIGRDTPSWQGPKMMPPVDDRSLNLVDHMVSEMDQDIIALLRQKVAAVPGAGADRDPTIHPYLEHGQFRGWEQGWAAYTSEGFLDRVVLRAYYGEPPQVVLLVNQMVMLASVPDWILARARGENVDRARELYRQRILTAVRHRIGIN